MSDSGIERSGLPVDLGVDLPENVRLYLKELTDSVNELKIQFDDVRLGLTLTLTFSNAYCYRVANESYRLKFLREFGAGIDALVSVSTDSEFIRWFHEQSDEVYIDNGLSHYTICSTDDVIDVISSSPCTAFLDKQVSRNNDG